MQQQITFKVKRFPTAVHMTWTMLLSCRRVEGALKSVPGQVRRDVSGRDVAHGQYNVLQEG